MLLADDLSADQIMARLCIERKSVENYKRSIGIALGLSGRDALNRYARRNRADLLTWYPILRRKPKPRGWPQTAIAARLNRKSRVKPLENSGVLPCKSEGLTPDFF